MQSSTVVLESQVDWLTAGTHHERNTDLLAAHAVAWIAAEQFGGNTVHPWHLMGFVGSRCGRVRWGTRGRGGLLQLSGDLAKLRWYDADRLADTMSRVDLAVTIRSEPPRTSLGLEAYGTAREAYQMKNMYSTPRLVTDAAGGTTVYVGDRSSDIFLRLYNKEQESLARKDFLEAEHYHGCWRYEVEYKGERANAARATLQKAQLQPDAVADLVYHEFQAHHIWPEFGAITPRSLIGGFRRRSDNDRRLAWFKTAVAPAVKALLDSGRRLELEDALGLTLPEQPF